jgi:3-methyladenine DNA glycosylase AlkC
MNHLKLASSEILQISNPKRKLLFQPSETISSILEIQTSLPDRKQGLNTRSQFYETSIIAAINDVSSFDASFEISKSHSNEKC